MKKLALAVIVLSATLSGQERIALTSPEITPNNTTYRVDRITLDIERGILDVRLLGVNNEPINCVYNTLTSPTGAALMTGLNKANLSSTYASNATTGSLNQRVFHRLVVMNESATVCTKALVGTLTGSVP